LVAAALYLCATASLADDARDNALLDRLLFTEVQGPDWRVALARPGVPHEQPPPPDAPREVLADFWKSAPNDIKPDSRVPPRLLAWCEEHPLDLNELLRWMPEDSTEVHDRLKKLVDRLLIRLHTERVWYRPINDTFDWLTLHSRYYRKEFLAGIRKEFSSTNGDYMARDIQALAKLDPKTAEKLLLELAQDRDAFGRTAALVWLHKLHLAGDNDPRLPRWRTELQKIAASRSVPVRAREYAISSLMQTPSEGQDEWFLRLFADPALGVFEYEGKTVQPLVGVVASDPDRWVPKIIPLVSSSNPAVHNNAVRCLSDFIGDHARADATEALLPWLTDPHWAELGGETPRKYVVDSLSRVALPQSVPGLIQVIEREHDEIAASAAQALAHQRANQAGPASRAAMSRDTDDLRRESMMQAAISLGAYSVDEMESAIMALIHSLVTDKGQEQLEDFDPILDSGQIDPQVRLGSLLWHASIENDELVERLVRHAGELAETEPQSAERIRVIVAGWPGEAAMNDIARHLQSGSLTAPWIKQLLADREKRAEPVGRLEGLHGVARGVQAACTCAATDIGSTLQGDDAAAQFTLMACARLTGLPLPTDAVAHLLEAKDARVSKAAEYYLMSIDSADARAAVLRHHPGEAIITGIRAGFPYDISGESAGPIAGAENLLHSMVLAEGGPREVFALLREGFSDDEFSQSCVLVYADKVILRALDGGGRQRERILAPEELTQLRGWLEAQQADDLVMYDEYASDGIQYEYLHLERNGGRRVFMNNPPRGPSDHQPYRDFHGNVIPDPGVYGRLVSQFNLLFAPANEVIYEAARALPGFRVLHRREDGWARALAPAKGGLIAQVLDQEDNTVWRTVGANGLNKVDLGEPHAFRDDAGIGHWKSEFAQPIREIFGPCSGRLTGQYLWAGVRLQKAGLWTSDERSIPKLFIRGYFGSPVATDGSEWIVTSRDAEDPAARSRLVRIHVTDRREYPIDAQGVDEFLPFAPVPGGQKVLLLRVKAPDPRALEDAPGPAQREFRLLDATTGAVEDVEGEFRPLFGLTWRKLQPTSRPNECWAALPADQLGSAATIVGRYDAGKFKFQPVLTVLGSSFSSLDMWVDEAARHVTFIVNGDILRLALP